MALLTATGIAKSFGDQTLFSNITFELGQNDRVGLVGVNGSGKTTLLRILSKAEPPTAGSVHMAKFCNAALLEQAPTYAGSITLYEETLRANAQLLELEKRIAQIESALNEPGADAEALARRQADARDAYENGGGFTFRSRSRSTLLGLGFTEEELEQPIASMSGGQMRKAALARMLLSGANLLLLDEPTNHLDLHAIEWLENTLLEYAGAFLVISHDRYFLDRVTTRTFELENGSLHTGNLPYSAYIEHKMDQRELDWRHYQNRLKEIKRIEGIIEQQRRWNQERNYVTIASKQKQIDRIKADLVRPETAPESIRFKLAAQPLTCNEVIACKELSAAYDGKTVFSGLNFMLHRDECVVLLGANGCGKSTLLNILTNHLEPQSGAYRIGPGVRIGYYTQNTTHTQNTNTLLDELHMRFPRYDLQQLRGYLGTFLFHGDDVQKRLNMLSGGEIARLQLLTMMLQGSNVLLLDEPTNHLDIASCEALENALDAYGGTMLIVTHDRYLANRLADRIVIMGYNGIEEFCGDWDAYQASLAAASASMTQEKAAQPKSDYAAAKERRSAFNRAKGALQRAEQAVSDGEADMQKLEERLSAPEIASDVGAINRLCEQIETLRGDLERRYAAWERAEADYTKLAREVEEA